MTDPGVTVMCLWPLSILVLYTYLPTLLTYSMEQSPSWEVDKFSASQEIPHNLRNPKVHYRFHRCQPPGPVLSQFDPFHTPHPTFWRSILILSSHLHLGLQSGLLHSSFPAKTLYKSILSPIRATCPAHLILLDFITRTILGEDYRSFSSSLCSFLHSPVTPSLLGPNVLLSTLSSNTLSLRSSLNVSGQVSHPYKTTGRIIVLYILIFKFPCYLYKPWDDSRVHKSSKWIQSTLNFNI